MQNKMKSSNTCAYVIKLKINLVNSIFSLFNLSSDFFEDFFPR